MLRPAPAAGSRTSPISTSSPRRSRPRRRPGTRRTGSPRSPGSACCGPTPTATPTGASDALGGGTYDAATDTYGQGAFNADDISRAAVVYLRDWQQTEEHVQPRPRPRAAARPDLPADRLRPERRQRRALDAARRHPEPQRGSGRAARPLGQRRVLLAGPHPVGAGGGIRLVPRLRPGLRTFPPGPAAARGPRRRPPVAGRLRPALPGRRPEHSRLADRRRRRRLRGGGARSGCLRPRRGRPRVASHAGAAE